MTLVIALGHLALLVVSSWAMVHLAGREAFLGGPIALPLLVLWSAWWITLALGRSYGPPSSHERGQRWIRILGGLTLLVYVLAAPWEHQRFSGPLPRHGSLAWVGLGFFAAGILLQVAALWALKSMYTMRLGIQAVHRLVTHGPYRWLRHPGYLSNLLCLGGFALAWSSLSALGATFLVGVLLVKRIPAEEAMLLEAFGPAYRAYQRHTWRLIPGLY